MTIPTIPAPANPQMIEQIIYDAQVKLAASLTWLNHSFGKAYPVREQADGLNTIRPTVYAGAGEYLPVLPCGDYGNFSFFHVDDPTKVEAQSRFLNSLSNDFGLIFWFDLSTIYPDTETRDIEPLKKEIMRALSSMRLDAGRITIEEISEYPDNVYRGYTFAEQNYIYSVHPYGCLRFSGKIKYTEQCS